MKHSRSIRKLVITELFNLFRDPDDSDEEFEPSDTALPLISSVLFAITDHFPTLAHVELYVVAGYDIKNPKQIKTIMEFPADWYPSEKPNVNTGDEWWRKYDIDANVRPLSCHVLSILFWLILIRMR